MFYVEIKENTIIGKSYNSFSEGMIEVEKDLYDMIKSVPAKFETSEEGKIINIIPIDIPEPESPKELTPEELKMQELESQIEGLQSALAEISMMMTP